MKRKMKTSNIKKNVAVIFFTMIVASVSAQENFLKKFENVNDVTSVYVSKSMLGLMSSYNSFGVKVGSIVSKLDNIQILAAEDEKSAKTLKNDFKVIMQNGRYESIMTVNEKGENTNIYMKKFSHGTCQFILLNTSKGETSIIVLTGKITINDIKNVTCK